MIRARCADLSGAIRRPVRLKEVLSALRSCSGLKASAFAIANDRFAKPGCGNYGYTEQ